MTKYTLECCQWESLLVALSLSHYYCQWWSCKYPVWLLCCSLESRIIRAKNSSHIDEVSWRSKLAVWHVRRPKIECFVDKMLLESREFSKKKKIITWHGGKLPWRSRHSIRDVFSRLHVFSRNRISRGLACGMWLGNKPAAFPSSTFTFDIFIVVNRIELGKRCHDDRWSWR